MRIMDFFGSIFGSVDGMSYSLNESKLLEEKRVM